MFYCDTSVLIAALTDEEHTATAAAWLVTQSPGQLVASSWADVELASGLGIKVRTGQLDEASRARAMQAWRITRAASFEIAPVEAQDFATATQLLDRPGLNLRAGDALHVAIALRLDLRLVTFDKGMAGAAVLAGLSVEPLSLS